MKRKIAIVLTFVLMMCTVIPTNSSDAFSASYDVKVRVNGVEVDFSNGLGQPFISDENRTLVPLRGTAEAYGCEVGWDADNYRAIVKYDSHYASVPINKTYVDTDAGKIDMDTYARIINDRTYLPIRYVMEAVGANVGWDALRRTVIVNRPDPMYIIKNFVKNYGEESSEMPETFTFSFYPDTTSYSVFQISYFKGLDYLVISDTLYYDGGINYTDMDLTDAKETTNTIYGKFTYSNLGNNIFDQSKASFIKKYYGKESAYVFTERQGLNGGLNSNSLISCTGICLTALDLVCIYNSLGISSSDFGYSSGL